jgi:PIN domain nuclease of toxin-antitoxin system
MLTYGVTEIQNKPSLLKDISIGEIVDKRAHKSLGYFVSSKYEIYMKSVIEKIEKEEKIKKLKKLKKHQDIEFLELGVDDGL